jgi:hypothetical protein
MCYGLPVRSQELGGRVQGLGVNAEPRAPGLFNQPPLEVEEGNLGERLLAGAWVLTGIAKCAATYLHMTLMCGGRIDGVSHSALQRYPKMRCEQLAGGFSHRERKAV